jgi:hypothetical protein
MFGSCGRFLVIFIIAGIGFHAGVEAGVTYPRWGRNTCPSGASLVYKGYMGSNDFRQGGGGADYVCLPDTPEWGNYKDGFQTLNRIYGTEYEDADPSTILSKANNGGNSLMNYDAVCAVCLVASRSMQIMIPAKRTCPTGWTMEYQGYLASEHYTVGKSMFICLDEAPEAVPATSAHLDGARLYVVEGSCGTLPCLPYVEGRELTCVVCTK